MKQFLLGSWGPPLAGGNKQYPVQAIAAGNDPGVTGLFPRH